MKILFICTHNRCRSILSEAITNHLSNGRIKAYSAGSKPAGEVHPLSIKYLSARKIPTEELVSQSWDVMEDVSPEVVITVCDSAANEACPVWFGNTVKIHWGLPDPSKLEASDAEVEQGFYKVMDIIETRVAAILSLTFETMSKDELQSALQTLTQENSTSALLLGSSRLT